MSTRIRDTFNDGRARRRSVRDVPRADLLLVATSGGHLQQLLALRSAWDGRSRVWVTNDRAGARSLLASETVVWAHWPTSRNVPNAFRNVVLALSLVRRSRPRVVLTTGAATAVPFAWIARLFGASVVFVESLTRAEAPSLSCRLVRPIASRVYVQWPEMTGKVPGSVYRGTVIGS